MYGGGDDMPASFPLEAVVFPRVQYLAALPVNASATLS